MIAGLHQHPHSHPRLQAPATSRTESAALVPPTRAVMVDIGDGAGALILDAGPERDGLEVLIHPVGNAAAHCHVYVLRRDLPSGPRWAAVFPSLAPGDYVVVGVDGSPGPIVTVEAGQVARGEWSDSHRPLTAGIRQQRRKS
jgi:hypothetical protein